MADSRAFAFGSSAAAASSAWSETLAGRADALAVYSDAVQEPDVECTNLDSLYCGSQHDDTDRAEARILREDFCSSALVAHTWLGLHPDNVSQGVDIDLAALRSTQRLFGAETVKIVQSAAFSGEPSTSVLQPEAAALRPTEASQEPRGASWAAGAASERFDRKLLKQKQKAERKLAKAGPSTALQPRTEPFVTLVHADVLDLPLPAAPSQPALPPPDLVASLNYALCYFHTRAGLLAYLTQVRRTLRPRTGRLICDQFAGPTGGEVYAEQAPLWAAFEREPGFLRPSDPRPELSGAPLQVVPPPPDALQDAASHTQWPRGQLKLVRRGEKEGGFEYWREDGPIDFATNRFRMSLSMRFSDGSWLRDVFAYDFRIWSLCEVVEAMKEVGFSDVYTYVLPRTARDDLSHAADGDAAAAPRSRSSSASSGSDAAAPMDDGDGMLDMAHLTRMTEREEAAKVSYQQLRPGDKLFASRSFATYIVACAPP